MNGGGRWLSKAAVLWAMDEARGVPPHLVAALLAIARYADENGRGAHPSALTVAAIIRKSERNAKKDLAALRELGLLVPGDQRIVKDIRADKRPFVYDLPMPRGVAQGPSGVSQATPKEFLKNSRTRAPRDRAGGASASALANTENLPPQPPCPYCGREISDWRMEIPEPDDIGLADHLEMYAVAMRGEMPCASNPCLEAASRCIRCQAQLDESTGYYMCRDCRVKAVAL